MLLDLWPLMVEEEVPEVPEPPPVVVGGGGTLVRRRWLPRAALPSAPPVRIRVRIHSEWRWTANVVGIAAGIRLGQFSPKLTIRPTSLTAWFGPLRKSARMRAVVKDLHVTPATMKRFGQEVRELNEIAVALAALE